MVVDRCMKISILIRTLVGCIVWEKRIGSQIYNVNCGYCDCEPMRVDWEYSTDTLGINSKIPKLKCYISFAAGWGKSDLDLNVKRGL
ncbi:hypothetical protein QTP88_017542 [Uroleucon formosanum]